MDALAADTWVVLPPLLIVLGLVGVVVPVLPGTLLVLAGVLVWALAEQSTTGWVVLFLSVLVAAAGRVLQYLVPGRRMKQRGVRTSTLALAVLLAVVGFFVIPVVGAPSVSSSASGSWRSVAGPPAGRRGRARSTPRWACCRAWGSS
ncbi:DUF456 domain-containing protein [Phycicoccus sp. HDW14]|uniref:DUF456 domain-containing protein n=1 Tax=Phycicoccus sp. HDW14 TaxID=2714941 RepID=UPI00197C3382|nr:DUF456 domain-containing protein [Phycicoccus sp. HDW14]